MGCSLILVCFTATGRSDSFPFSAWHTVPEHRAVLPEQFGNQIGNAYALLPLKRKIHRTDSALVVVRVLHIGDSHVKSGFFSEHFMERLNAYYAKKYRGNLFFNFQVFCKIGTRYSDYDGLAELDNQLVREKPDLVIVSLGTNDAFSGSSRLRFYEKIGHLVNKVKALSPQAVILLTTPSDALKKNPLTGIYTALPELQAVTNEIIRYANDHQVAYWNLYQIMGGAYSVNNWYQRKMAAPDRVHFNAKGYTMFADWLFDAFTASMESASIDLPLNIHY
jgi:hypothetical protein